MYGAKSVNTRAIENLNDTFATNIDEQRWVKVELKAPPGARAEMENVKTTILTFSNSALPLEVTF